MEGLIIFILVAVISSFIGKNKNKQSQQMPPFNPGAEPTSVEPKQERPTIHSFEDFAKEFLSEVKESMEQSKSKKGITEVAKVPQQMPAPRENMESRLDERRVNREPIQQTRERDFIAPVTKPSQKALIQAVVMAEVLGPPKAKQHVRKHSS